MHDALDSVLQTVAKLRCRRADFGHDARRITVIKSGRRAREQRKPDIEEPIMSIEEAHNATEDPWEHISKRTWQTWRRSGGQIDIP